jgi:CheY-like chemotaxis protein
LLVEDNEDNIETLRDYLEAHGYRVMVVCNGQQAVQAIIDHMPDLVLMDAQMPEMDGFSATARIRAMPQFADLPIIILTALSMDSDRQKAMSAGATAYIAKPFSLRSLVQKIDKLLNIEQGR